MMQEALVMCAAVRAEECERILAEIADKAPGLAAAIRAKDQ